MKRRWTMVLWALAAAATLGCGDDSDHDAGTDTGTDGEVAPDADVPTDVPADVPADVPTDVPADVPGDTPTDPWDVVVTVEQGATAVPVNLSGLPRTTYEGAEAVTLASVVDAATGVTAPWNQAYDPIGNDGFDPLVERLENDRGRLPHYGELALGYLAWDAGSGQLRISWDASLGFPGSLRVRGMEGGTIRLLPYGTGEVLVKGGGVRALVTLSGLTTVSVVDPRHPELGAQPMVRLTDLLAAAVVPSPETLAYRMIATDGYAVAADNRMPYTHLTHGYIKPSDRGIVLEDGFDSTGRSWRVRDTVIVLGETP